MTELRMIYQLKPYLDALLAERMSSWALLSILYLLAGLFVRSWFIGPLFSSLKELERPISKNLRGQYLKKSLLGWIFFLLPLALFLLLGRGNSLGFPVNDNLVIASAAACFIFSIFLHLTAFGLAAVFTTKKISETQEKKLFEA